MERVHALAQARYEKKWSIEQVAEMLEVAPSTVGRWERGERSPRPDHKQALLQLYGKTAEELGLSNSSHCVGECRDTSSLLEEEEDASLTYRREHLFLRLLRMAWNWPSHVDHQELQAMILLELEGNAIMDFTRRDALRLLASFPLEVGAVAALSSSSSKHPISSHSKNPNESLLSPIAAGITACYELSRGNELAFAGSTVSKYIPMLKEVTTSSKDTRTRKVAADLLVQCYVLKSNLAVHLESTSVALRYAKAAESLVEQAQNQLLAIKVATVEANAHDYAGRKKLALQASQKAKYLLETNKESPQSPLIASYVYRGLANYQAQNGQKEDALSSLRKAHTTFFESTPQSDAHQIWVSSGIAYGKSNLLLHDGLVHYYLGLHKKAVDSFQQINTLPVPDASELNRVEALIDQVWSIVMREEGRNQELCIDLWKRGIQGAIVVQSEAQYEDGMAALTAMRAAWPGDVRVKELQDYAVHW